MMRSLTSISSTYLALDSDILPSTDIYSASLSPNVERTLSVPSGAQIAVFTYTGDVWVNYDTTAAVPSGAFAKAGGELKPKMRYVGDTTTLHLVSKSACECAVAFFSK